MKYQGGSRRSGLFLHHTLVQGLIPVLVLAGVTCIVFFDHLRGLATFPWDFTGGYHAQAVGWYSNGSFLEPTQWMPWTSFGFPAYLAPQSGSWYPPLAVLDALGLEYDLVLATRVQVLHVLWGALGIYYFLGTFTLSRFARLVGAVAFLFVPAFFANSEHVDIVRGYAWIPWVLVALSSQHAKRWYSFVLGPLVLFCFFTGAYPGLFLPMLLTAAIWVVYQHRVLSLEEPERQSSYCATVLIIMVCGLLASALKWLPAAMSLDEFTRALPQIDSLVPPLLPTTLLPYDFAFLPHDVTMRSLFVPLPILAATMLVVRPGPARTLATWLLVVGATGASALWGLTAVYREVPLMTLSRFPVSDWRVVIVLALTLLGALGLDLLRSESVPSPYLRKRLFLAAMCAGGLLWYADSLGFPAGDRAIVTAFLSATIVALLWFSRARSPASRRSAQLLIMVVVVVNGFWYHSSVDRAWNYRSPASFESSQFGAPIAEIIRNRDSSVLEARPPRLVLHTLEEIRGNPRLVQDPRYNLAYYQGTFAAFGYDNLPGFDSLMKISARLLKDDLESAEELFSFLLAGSKVLILDPGQNVDAVDLASCATTEDFACAVAEGDVAMGRFGINGAVFSIDAAEAVTIVENESWARGWSAVLESPDGERLEIEAIEVGPGLRGWSIPPGLWSLTTRYRTPFESWGWLAFASSILIAGIFGGRRALATAQG